MKSFLIGERLESILNKHQLSIQAWGVFCAAGPVAMRTVEDGWIAARDVDALFTKFGIRGKDKVIQELVDAGLMTRDGENYRIDWRGQKKKADVESSWDRVDERYEAMRAERGTKSKTAKSEPKTKQSNVVNPTPEPPADRRTWTPDDLRNADAETFHRVRDDIRDECDDLDVLEACADREEADIRSRCAEFADWIDIGTKGKHLRIQLTRDRYKAYEQLRQHENWQQTALGHGVRNELVELIDRLGERSGGVRQGEQGDYDDNDPLELPRLIEVDDPGDVAEKLRPELDALVRDVAATFVNIRDLSELREWITEQRQQVPAATT